MSKVPSSIGSTFADLKRVGGTDAVLKDTQRKVESPDSSFRIELIWLTCQPSFGPQSFRERASMFTQSETGEVTHDSVEAEIERAAKERQRRRIICYAIAYDPIFHGRWHASRAQAQAETNGHAIEFAGHNAVVED